jgi:hypothetical protein
LALDWLGKELSPAERAAMEEQIATKGAPACYRSVYGMKYPDRVRGWSMNPAENFPGKIDLSRWPLILNATNLKIIPTCALGIAGVHLHGRHPEAARWLELAQQSAQSFATMYGSDGCYDEGAGYWGYTTMHLIMFAEVQYRRLGVDQVLDYTTVAFESAIEPVDVVLDTLGGEIQARSWQVLKPGGILVSIASPPDPAVAVKHGVRQAFVFTEPNAGQLSELATLVDGEKLKVIVETILPLSDATRAQELSERGHTRGKIVLRVV